MRYSLFLFIAFLWFPFPVHAQQTVAGTVYRDANANNTMDAAERGIPGVPVSNGRQVVLTDSGGRYRLTVDGRDGKVFVIKPAGYELPRDKQNHPRFYYLHKPGGSPDLDYQGVAPTGELPEEVNFGLFKKEAREKYRVLLFGDPQPYSRKEVRYFDRDIVSELEGTDRYEFGITLGDIVGDNLALFQPYSKSISKIGLPWFNVMGNHDVNRDAEQDRYADETFEAVFGPPTYSFNYGKAHFIILDDVVYPRRDGKEGYIGGLTEKQLEFIENDLKHVPRDRLVVLAFHIPMFTEGKGDPAFRIRDRERLFDLLKDYPRTLSLSAHTHIQQFHFFDSGEGWERVNPHIHYNAGTTNGDWWSGIPDGRGIPPTLMRDGTPNGYAILNISGSDFTIDYKVANRSRDYRMSTWGPKVVPRNSWHGAQLYVNYFLGSRYTRVEYRLKGRKGNWEPMSRVSEQDPHVAALREKWDTADNVLEGKRPSNPVPSSHLWKTGVPNNLPPGRQTIEIRVTDMFGRTFRDQFTYEVVDSKR